MLSGGLSVGQWPRTPDRSASSLVGVRMSDVGLGSALGDI